MKLLLYCTKAKSVLRKLDNYFLDKHNDNYYWEKGQTVPYSLNGKIVAECDFEVEKITTFKDYSGYEEYDIHYQTAKRDYERLLQETCLNNQQLDNYLLGKNGYAIHIKNLHIFDEPRELSEVCKYDFWASEMFGINATSKDLYVPITKAPQNMMRVYKLENIKWGEYILISIQPQWLCKILNGEKTIEVRKKVLKEMLG